MAHRWVQRATRNARRGDESHHTGTLFMGISIALLAATVLMSGCSPYPVYTATNHSRPQPVDDQEAVSDSDPGWSQQTVDEPNTPEDEEYMPVQPTIFSRVVDDYLGVPYVLGGGGVNGIDCSNLVRVLYRDYDGTRLPASTGRLYKLPGKVSRDDLAVGDLVFFKFNGADVSHVGVYLGDGHFVHASESQGVIVSSLADSTYRERYAGARRVR